VKILYKQPETGQDAQLPFHCLGIGQCYLKQIHFAKDIHSISKKVHHHTFYEVHFIASGSQSYAEGNAVYSPQTGQFLLIPPMCPHQLISSDPSTEKFALVFSVNPALAKLPDNRCIVGTIPEDVWGEIRRIQAESAVKSHLSGLLIGGSVFSIIVWLLRQAGLKESTESSADTGKDPRLPMAKQYILDNIELSPTISDAAGYCYLSSKQLTRLFLHYEGISPAQYIRQQKVLHIQQLLRQNELSLRQISERMHFNNEYYFSTFFKKHSGTTPGLYRKMYIGE